MKTAMILAAGRGERLHPITQYCPKALCQVHGKALIEHHIERLSASGFEHIVINHAYLGWKIRQYLGNGQQFGVQITYLPEPPGGLETGGGIVNALPYLGDKPFLVVNADIYTHYDFGQIPNHMPSLAHLTLVRKPDYKKQGDFGLSEENNVTNSNRDYTFTGIAVYHPEVFSILPTGRYSLTPTLRKLAEQGKVSGEVYEGFWMDIGTKERLALANRSY